MRACIRDLVSSDWVLWLDSAAGWRRWMRRSSAMDPGVWRRVQLNDYRSDSLLSEMRRQRQYAGDCASVTQLPLEASLVNNALPVLDQLHRLLYSSRRTAMIYALNYIYSCDWNRVYFYICAAVGLYKKVLFGGKGTFNENISKFRYETISAYSDSRLPVYI